MKTLSETDWARVFTLRCRAKRGEDISREEGAFLTAAYRADPARYGALSARVFEETAPFGSRQKS